MTLSRNRPLGPGARSLARRSTFKPRSPGHNQKRKSTARGDERRRREAFRAAAETQGKCRACGSTRRWEAAHVPPAQFLARHGADPLDPRAAVRLCSGFRYEEDGSIVYGCHRHEHDGTRRRLPARVMTDACIELLVEVRGPAAIDWIRSHFRDVDDDPRLTAMLAAVRGHWPGPNLGRAA
jgi:hypothetical protein